MSGVDVLSASRSETDSSTTYNCAHEIGPLGRKTANSKNTIVAGSGVGRRPKMVTGKARGLCMQNGI